MYLSLLDCPAISQAHNIIIYHHWFPSFGVVNTSVYLTFFLMVTILKIDSNCLDLNLNLLDQPKNVE